MLAPRLVFKCWARGEQTHKHSVLVHFLMHCQREIERVAIEVSAVIDL